MILSAFNNNQTILEGGYSRTYEFDYPRYRVDPRPHVMVLGHWRHPNTRNKLLGGINLHYLDNNEINQLRKELQPILQRKGLKARYRYGLRVMPMVFGNYYRTYRSDEIHSVDPGTLRYWHPDADARRQAKERRRQERERLAAAKIKKDAETAGAAADAHAISHDHELDDDQLRGASKDDWRRKEMVQRQLGHNPLIDQDEDEDEIEQEIKLAEIEAEKLEDERELDEIDELDEGYSYNKDLGFIWDSPEVYRKLHTPHNYSAYRPRLYGSIADFRRKKTNALIHVESGEIIVDGCDHLELLQESGWDYHNTIRLEYNDGEVVAHHEDDVNADSILRQFLASEAGYYFLALNEHGRHLSKSNRRVSSSRQE